MESAHISPKAEVHTSVMLGSETVVWQFATICEGTVFGARCVIGAGAWIGKDVVAGNDVRIQSNAFVPNGTVLGNRVFVGPNAVLTDDKRPRVCNTLYNAEPPILESDCNIGAGAVILPDIHIGRGATVGAGSVVTHDVPDGWIVYGVPAKKDDTI